METTNNLKYSVTKKTSEGYLKVEIRLNDECKNGMEDFAITAELNKFESFSDNGFICGGCMHKDIVKEFPEFKIFVDLHLSDCNGLPMYAVANGNYHFENSGKEVTKSYLRLNDEEYNKLVKLKTVEGLIGSTDILSRWKKEANEAIQLLEELNDNKVKFESENLIEV